MKSITPFYFDSQALQALLEKHKTEFSKAKPFPHIVIDHFVPDSVLDQVVEEFPKTDEVDWTLWGPGDIKNTKDKNIEKVGTSFESNFGPFTRHFMSQLNSDTFVRFIQSLTQTQNILVDPSYNGCGLHSTGRGGRLMVHIDTNRHPISDSDLIHQRYNLILFLNKDWKEEYGGHLQLWNRDTTKCEKKIAPLFNRCVIFDTGSYSYHGHPEPLNCPEGRRRNSLAVYYYELNRRPDLNYRGVQRTVGWVATQSDEKGAAAKDWGMILKTNAIYFAKRITPPILTDFFKHLKHRLFPVFLLAALGAGLAGCQQEIEHRYFLVAQKTQSFPGSSVTLNIVQRYEKKRWCESQKEMYIREDEFKATCTDDGSPYKPMFESKAVGKWYVIRRFGRFSASLVFYEFNPPIPDAMMVSQLKKIGPHVLQFAALHKAPAKVDIISPEGKIVET